jgi:pyrroloquinoline quinone biosynthesis protein B
VHLRVLGAAAGGGSPQWNCGCANCEGLRRHDPALRPRSQASAAVSADGTRWWILNASPDVRTQIEAFPALHPRGLRASPVAGVVLTNGDVDACLGLFVLREDQALELHATAAVEQGLREHNALTRTLERRSGRVTWKRLVARAWQPLGAGLELLALPVPGTVPLHLSGLVAASEGDNSALVLRDPAGRTIVYAPTVAGWSAELEAYARVADVLCFDGTFYRDDELTALGLGQRSARQMAHWPLAGAEGSLRWLASLPCRRKLLVHVNNTNPILRDDAPERAELAAAGVEVAHDGLEVHL